MDTDWIFLCERLILAQVLCQRLMRAACVRKQVDDLKMEFAKRFRHKGGRL